MYINSWFILLEYVNTLTVYIVPNVYQRIV